MLSASLEAVISNKNAIIFLPINDKFSETIRMATTDSNSSCHGVFISLRPSYRTALMVYYSGWLYICSFVIIIDCRYRNCDEIQFDFGRRTRRTCLLPIGPWFLDLYISAWNRVFHRLCCIGKFFYSIQRKYSATFVYRCACMCYHYFE